MADTTYQILEAIAEFHHCDGSMMGWMISSHPILKKQKKVSLRNMTIGQFI